MSPRVLFVDHVGVLGGAELSLLDVARHFRDTSEVVLFERGLFLERLREEGIRAQVWPAGHAVNGVTREGGWRQDLQAVPGVLHLAWRVARYARSFDCLYANSQKAMAIAGLAGAIARRPVIWHLRDLLTPDHFSNSHRYLAAGLANVFASHVVANSQATADAFVHSGGRTTTTVVYNGIDSAPFDAVEEIEAAGLREALGIGDAPLVGVFSRLAPWKGQHVLIEALADLPGVHGLLVGGALFGPEVGYEEELRAMARQRGVEDRLHLLGFRHDVSALMRATDVVAHTSTKPEPFGRVIVEAMMAGRPVIATDAGGAREIVDSGRTGLLVEPGDPSALRRAILDILARPSLASALAVAGSVAARGRFDSPAMIQGVTEVLASTCSRKL